jgi:hypothetical protein
MQPLLDPPTQAPRPTHTKVPQDTHSEHAPSPTSTFRTPPAPTHSPSPDQQAPTNGNDQIRGNGSSSTNPDTTSTSSSSQSEFSDPHISTIFGGVQTTTLSGANPDPNEASSARQHNISRAVIIAAVLGSILAIMVVALLVFSYLRRRGRHRSRLQSPGQSETSQRGINPLVPFPLEAGQDARCIAGEDPGRSKSNLSLPLLNATSGAVQPTPAITPRRKNTLIRRVFRALRMGDRSGRPEPFYMAPPADNPPSYRQEDAVSTHSEVLPSYHRRQPSSAPPSYRCGREKGDQRRSIAPPLPTNRTM